MDIVSDNNAETEIFPIGFQVDLRTQILRRFPEIFLIVPLAGEQTLNLTGLIQYKQRGFRISFLNQHRGPDRERDFRLHQPVALKMNRQLTRPVRGSRQLLFEFHRERHFPFRRRRQIKRDRLRRYFEMLRHLQCQCSLPGSAETVAQQKNIALRPVVRHENALTHGNRFSDQPGSLPLRRNPQQHRPGADGNADDILAGVPDDVPPEIDQLGTTSHPGKQPRLPVLRLQRPEGDQPGTVHPPEEVELRSSTVVQSPNEFRPGEVVRQSVVCHISRAG